MDKDMEMDKEKVNSKVIDRETLYNNILYLQKNQGKFQMKELEKMAGVSIGYISRIKKDKERSLGIDFIANVADALDVTIDTLLKAHLQGATPNEIYLANFVTRLIRETRDNRLRWKREPKEANYFDERYQSVFASNAYGKETYINGDCFKVKLRSGASLYLMDIGKKDTKSGDILTTKEIWISETVREREVNYLCGDSEEKLFLTIQELYTAVKESFEHPVITSSIRNIIDNFMHETNRDRSKMDV